MHEYLEDFKDKQDVLRYVLCANAPETKDNDFTWNDFKNRNNNELVAILGNFVNRTLVLTNKYFDGIVPEIQKYTDDDKKTINELPKIKSAIESSLENFRFREGLKYAMDYARLGNKYLADTEPWNIIKTDENRVKTILNISLQITANLAAIIEPFLPYTAGKLSGYLNIKKLAWDETGSINILPSGHKINNPDLLFEKIEDYIIDKQLNKLKSVKTGNTPEKSNIMAQKENISFDDFTKMDIRVGKIINAARVPKTDKLLQLTIDTGIDQRTVVAGIAEYYDPEKIIGKQVSILVNLEPRNIRGIESRGMILAAEDSKGKLTLITPDDSIEEGAVIR